MTENQRLLRIRRLAFSLEKKSIVSHRMHRTRDISSSKVLCEMLIPYPKEIKIQYGK